MIGKHNTGGFCVPESPPAWPTEDQDAGLLVNATSKIAAYCKQQWGYDEVFPYFFIIHPSKPGWHAKVLARYAGIEFDLEFTSGDGESMTCWKNDLHRRNDYSIGSEF